MTIYCLMIGSYVGGLNRELFLHTDKNSFLLLLETNKCRKAFAFRLCICSCLLSIYFYIDLGMSSLDL